VFLASSDLTHYGPWYRFAPAGVGQAGLNWAKENDRLLIDRILRMQEQSIVPEVRARHSACGAGAIAATLAACKELGASRATLLRHTNSFETLAQVAPQSPDNAVGYASIVVG
jgi:MEMO1 family protein